MLTNIGFLVFGGVVLLAGYVGWLIYRKEYCKVHKTWRKNCGCR
jgi:chromate transport protein ChrA